MNVDNIVLMDKFIKELQNNGQMLKNSEVPSLKC